MWVKFSFISCKELRDVLPALPTLIVNDYLKPLPIPIILQPQIHSTQFFLLKFKSTPPFIFKLQECLSQL